MRTNKETIIKKANLLKSMFANLILMSNENTFEKKVNDLEVKFQYSSDMNIDGKLEIKSKTSKFIADVTFDIEDLNERFFNFERLKNKEFYLNCDVSLMTKVFFALNMKNMNLTDVYKQVRYF